MELFVLHLLSIFSVTEGQSPASYLIKRVSLIHFNIFKQIYRVSRSAILLIHIVVLQVAEMPWKIVFFCWVPQSTRWVVNKGILMVFQCYKSQGFFFLGSFHSAIFNL